MSGVVKSVDKNGTITLEDGSTHTHAKNVSVTLNGKSSSVGELKAGDKVSLSGDPVASPSATRAL